MELCFSLDKSILWRLFTCMALVGSLWQIDIFHGVFIRQCSDWHLQEIQLLASAGRITLNSSVIASDLSLVDLD
jgi:hypothetical protein